MPLVGAGVADADVVELVVVEVDVGDEEILEVVNEVVAGGVVDVGAVVELVLVDVARAGSSRYTVFALQISAQKMLLADGVAKGEL